MAMVIFSWKGEEVGLSICRTPQAAAELQARWGGGPVIVERIFDIESPSSFDARRHIANKVLRAAGEELQLTADNPELCREQMQLVSRDPAIWDAPLPEPVAVQAAPVAVSDGITPAQQAQALIDRMASIPAHKLTGVDKQRLMAARALLLPAQPFNMEGSEIDYPEGEPVPEEMDPEVLRTMDPTMLTGRQKAALGGRSAHVKPRPRQAFTPDGRDPRTLTGPEKRLLAHRGKLDRRQRTVIAAQLPPVNELSAQEAHELGMLRAGQGGTVVSLEGLTGAPLVAAQRFELALRRQHGADAAARVPGVLAPRSERGA